MDGRAVDGWPAKRRSALATAQEPGVPRQPTRRHRMGDPSAAGGEGGQRTDPHTIVAHDREAHDHRAGSAFQGRVRPEHRARYSASRPCACSHDQRVFSEFDRPRSAEPVAGGMITSAWQDERRPSKPPHNWHSRGGPILEAGHPELTGTPCHRRVTPNRSSSSCSVSVRSLSFSIIPPEWPETWRKCWWARQGLNL